VALADRLTEQQLQQLRHGEAMHWLVVSFDSLELEQEYAGVRFHMIVRYGAKGYSLEHASNRVRSTGKPRPRVVFAEEIALPYSVSMTPVLHLKVRREGVFSDWTIAKTAVHVPFRAEMPGAVDKEVLFIRKRGSALLGRLGLHIALQQLRPGSDSASSLGILQVASLMMEHGQSSYSDFAASCAASGLSKGSLETLSKQSTCSSLPSSSFEADTPHDAGDLSLESDRFGVLTSFIEDASMEPAEQIGDSVRAYVLRVESRILSALGVG